MSKSLDELLSQYYTPKQLLEMEADVEEYISGTEADG